MTPRMLLKLYSLAYVLINGHFQTNIRTYYVRMIVPEDNEQTKRPKNSDQMKHLSNNILEFMNNSSIHGLKYLVGNGSTIFEKIVWCILLLISICTCSLMIRSVWQKWEENPAFIGIGQNRMRLWEIPFPAVTVCVEYLLNKESNHTFSYMLGKENWQVGNASTYCDAVEEQDFFSDTEFSLLDYFEGQKWEEYLTKTSIQPEQFLRNSYFGSQTIHSIQFSPVLTEWGVCYSFNMLDKKDLLRNITFVQSAFGNQNNVSSWTYDKNYPTTNEIVYPHRSRSIEDKLMLDLSSELNKIACSGYNRYAIQLHHPGEATTMKNNILIEPNKAYDILIKPDITITAENLKTYSPYRKKCFFSDERYLYFYKIYTQENCYLECLANYTLRNCGCVLPELPHHKTTKLCGRYNNSNLDCIMKSEDLVLEVESGLRENNLDLPLCNCLPSCNSITYDTEVRVTDSLLNMTYVTVQFKHAQFNVFERQELFGDINFWASCGGILGLFIGLSVMSLAEIIYYLFFRWLYGLGKLLWK